MPEYWPPFLENKDCIRKQKRCKGLLLGHILDIYLYEAIFAISIFCAYSSDLLVLERPICNQLAITLFNFELVFYT